MDGSELGRCVSGEEDVGVNVGGGGNLEGERSISMKTFISLPLDLV